MKSDEPPTTNEKINEALSNENISDEQFEDKLAEELRKKRQQELEDNLIFAMKNCF